MAGRPGELQRGCRGRAAASARSAARPAFGGKTQATDEADRVSASGSRSFSSPLLPRDCARRGFFCIAASHANVSGRSSNAPTRAHGWATPAHQRHTPRTGRNPPRAAVKEIDQRRPYDSLRRLSRCGAASAVTWPVLLECSAHQNGAQKRFRDTPRSQPGTRL
jgi:hypothetical protein